MSPLPRPTLAYILGFWLRALLPGTVLTGLSELVTYNSSPLAGLLAWSALVFLGAAVFSLPALLGLLWLVPRALTVAFVPARWVFIPGLQLLSLVLTGALAQHYLGHEKAAPNVWLTSMLYALSGWPVAVWRFWPWLWPSRRLTS